MIMFSMNDPPTTTKPSKPVARWATGPMTKDQLAAEAALLMDGAAGGAGTRKRKFDPRKPRLPAMFILMLPS